MSSWISMASTFQEVVDCRMVQLELEFHQVSKEERGQLAELCASEMYGLFSENCYIRWEACGREKTFRSVLESIQRSKGNADFGFDGDVFPYSRMKWK